MPVLTQEKRDRVRRSFAQKQSRDRKPIAQDKSSLRQTIDVMDDKLETALANLSDGSGLSTRDVMLLLQCIIDRRLEVTDG